MLPINQEYDLLINLTLHNHIEFHSNLNYSNSKHGSSFRNHTEKHLVEGHTQMWSIGFIKE